VSGQVTRIDAKELKARLHDGGEIALLDAREELPFGRRHLLMASCVPLSRLELLVDDLVPRRATRVVWCDDDEGLAARAAARMAALGYWNVALLDGGIAAWEAAGFRVYSGVHVPSKAFAEVVEHEAATPWISAEELKALIDRKADIAIYDSRSYEEYHNNSIPTAVSVPGAELVYRFADLMPSSATTVIVNCGGRTRSIIGAQSLINAGVANKVVSLKDGTMAWHWPTSVSCTARRGGRPTLRQLGCRRRSSARPAWQRATTSRESTGAPSRRGAPKRPSAASTCSTSARRKNTRPATCAARGWRRADSSCRKPTAIWRPGALAPCWWMTTAFARP
jgi:rhodanese-related sulfurtransferase